MLSSLPTPPVDAVAPALFSVQCAVFYAVLAAGVLAYGLWHWHRTGRPVMVLLVLSGGLTVLVEPYVDLIGAAWHPRYGQQVVFEMFGRPIPWWMISAYFAYFGGMGAVNYLAFSRGVSARAIRIWFLAPMLFDVMIEEVMLTKKLYIYYGAQPLMFVGKLPFWWVPCNSTGEFLGVFLALMLAPNLRGWKTLFLLLVFPMGDLMGYALVAFPSVAAINTPAPYWVEQAAGVMTYALAGLVVYGVSCVIARDSKLNFSKQAVLF